MSEVALAVAPEAARHPGNGLRQTSSPTSPRNRAALGESTTSIAMPSAGPPSEQALIGAVGVGERKHAPTSVPPEQLMIGQRAAAYVLEQPAVRLRVPRLPGRDEHAQRREVVPLDELVPWGSARASSVGERPSIVTRSLLDQAARAGRARASRARPPRRRSCSRAPSARPPSHGPMIQPMSVTKWITSSGRASAW